ncbi:putative Pre-mRNA polyadenylation factor FIP1 [Xylogone sp. PMI_703]|nr:putative Pre-mRNA polyadenylation factor FIP1 [Xylogone sp. PMI_703]
MDIDEDDDFYAPEEPIEPTTQQHQSEETSQAQAPKQEEGDLEEGEEEDEEEDSDIDIITERKDGSKAAPPPQSRYNEIRNIPQRTTSNDAPTKPVAAKKETSAKPVSGADLPGIATSKIDVDAKPIYEPAGKPITQVDIDEDLGENDKPWRRPGTDITDYFNYGFDEFTWALYASKQESLRAEYNQEKIAANNKKMFEDLNMMMAMGGMPGMPGMPAAGGATLPPMPGMEGIPPEMQAMMQQMMASGIDPTQMDPAAMFAGMQGNQAAAAGATGAANQGQGFGGQGGFGQGQNQQMGFGYDQNMMAGGDARNRGGNFGRGRGGRRNW